MTPCFSNNLLKSDGQINKEMTAPDLKKRTNEQYSEIQDI